MSKKVGFPVMSTMITGILFLLGLLLTTLGIVLKALVWVPESTGALVVAIVWFFGLLLFGWALLSFALNPELEDYQRNVAFFFAVLVVTILFGVGIQFVVTAL